MSGPNKLYNFLKTKCPLIRQEQCAQIEKTTAGIVYTGHDIDEFNTIDGHELTFFYKILNLYSRELHSYIPIIDKVWQDQHTFYLQTVTTANMCTFDKILQSTHKPIILTILIELGIVLNIIHNMGVSHGFVHETSLFLDDKMLSRIVLKNFVGYNNSNYDFVAQKRKDVRDYMAMLRRVMTVTRIDLSKVFNKNLETINDIVETLRQVLWTDIAQQEFDFNMWHDAVHNKIINTHELRNVNINTTLSSQSMQESALLAFTTVAKTKTLLLPLFIDSSRPERGISATIPVVHGIFDNFVTSSYFVKRRSDSLFLIPNSNKLLANETVKNQYIFAGYMLAYVFFMKIPINYVFSETIVNFIMSTSMAPLSFVDAYEKQQLYECKEQLCLMKLGARKLTDAVFTGNYDGNAKHIFDYFYNIQYKYTTLPMLGEDSYHFDNTFTESERYIFMKWVKSLCLDKLKSALFTLLLTNCRFVYRSQATAVTIRKTNTYGGSIVSTCEQSITVPSAWMSSYQVFNEHMTSLLINDNEEEKNDIVFNAS